MPAFVAQMLDYFMSLSMSRPEKGKLGVSN
jgi:hypothetical protein